MVLMNVPGRDRLGSMAVQVQNVLSALSWGVRAAHCIWVCPFGGVPEPGGAVSCSSISAVVEIAIQI